MTRLECIGGRLMRHDPQPDDAELMTDRGECPDCRGKGCGGGTSLQKMQTSPADRLRAQIPSSTDPERLERMARELEAKQRPRFVPCLEPGPEESDGMTTSCMAEDGHNGPHDWTRDDSIFVAFAEPEPIDRPCPRCFGLGGHAETCRKCLGTGRV